VQHTLSNALTHAHRAQRARHWCKKACTHACASAQGCSITQECVTSSGILTIDRLLQFAVTSSSRFFVSDLTPLQVQTEVRSDFYPRRSEGCPPAPSRSHNHLTFRACQKVSLSAIEVLRVSSFGLSGSLVYICNPKGRPSDVSCCMRTAFGFR
jgi:hypothetical protein